MFPNKMKRKSNIHADIIKKNLSLFYSAMNKYALFAITVAVCLSCSQSISFRDMPDIGTGWNMYGGDPCHTNSTDSDIKPPLVFVRKIKVSSGIGDSPVVSDGVIYVPGLGRKLETFNLITGRKRGQIKVDAGIIAAPVIWDGKMYYTQSKGINTFLGYNVYRGEHVWRKKLGPIDASPVLCGGKFFVATLDGRLYCIEKEDGSIIWQARVEDSIYTSPAVSGKTVVIGTADGKMYAYQFDTGEKIWEKQISAGIISSPGIADGTVFIGTTSNVFYALDLKSGEIKWEFETDGKIYSPPALKDSFVLFGCNDKFVYALDRNDGKLLWKYDAKGLVNTPPVIAGSFVYVGSLDHYIYGLDLFTGEKLWDYKTEGKIKSSPVIYKDYLIVPVENRKIFVFKKQEPEPEQ